MGDLIRNRVRARLDDLGLNPFEAARIAGFERSYFNDLLIEKKHTIRESKLQDAARALQCDPDYLLGRQDKPRLIGREYPDRLEHNLRLAGVCEADAWRPVDYALPDFGPLPLNPDPRYPADDQEAYVVRGDHAAGIGINDGSLICIVKLEALEQAGRVIHDGDVVLVRHDSGSGLYELTARIVEESREGLRLSAKPARGEMAPLAVADDIVIVGLILRSIRVFGLPV
jgi:transcriptional regulator with XRE-family HTH domain